MLDFFRNWGSTLEPKPFFTYQLPPTAPTGSRRILSAKLPHLSKKQTYVKANYQLPAGAVLLGFHHGLGGMESNWLSPRAVFSIPDATAALENREFHIFVESEGGVQVPGPETMRYLGSYSYSSSLAVVHVFEPTLPVG